jgi:hypothetical protein
MEKEDKFKSFIKDLTSKRSMLKDTALGYDQRP